MDKETIGLIGIALVIIAYSRYFYSIYKGTTKPHLFSWLLWFVLMSVAFVAQLVEGAGAGAWPIGLGALLTFSVMICSFKYGEKDIKKSDWVILALGLSAIPLWLLTKNPLWSVILVSMIDASGYIPTFRKSWHKPDQENAIFFGLDCLIYVTAILALENLTLTTYLYPATLFVMNVLLTVMLLYRRAVLRNNTIHAA